MGQAAVHLQDTTGGMANCNNIYMLFNRFEQLLGSGVYLGDDSRKNALSRCKFDGCGKGVTFDGALCTFIGEGTQFTGTTGSGVEGVNGDGLIFQGGIYDGCGGYGIDVGASTNTVIVGNVLGRPNACTLGKYNASAGSNQIANNPP